MERVVSSSANYTPLEQENIIESILFMMGESVSVDTLATAIESTVDVAKEAAERLYTKYQNEYQDRGMKVIKLGSKYQMVSNNKYFKNLVLVASHPQKPVITESILETLSIIAYKQPISKPEIEHIRGVKSDYACNRLLEYGLIEEKGRLETAGRPILFGTTEEFMLRFGIESLDDLPILDATKFAEIESEVEKELTETLGEPVVIDKNKYTENVTDSASSETDSEEKVEDEEKEKNEENVDNEEKADSEEKTDNEEKEVIDNDNINDEIKIEDDNIDSNKELGNNGDKIIDEKSEAPR
ncbi:MAG: SMC-Scp complex subunit ScpB [Lachnospiraceae bacterium]|nr:SMC-Scp complex subunit ScpB [Lachnospiraceae bacterium]